MNVSRWCYAAKMLLRCSYRHLMQILQLGSLDDNSTIQVGDVFCLIYVLWLWSFLLTLSMQPWFGCVTHGQLAWQCVFVSCWVPYLLMFIHSLIHADFFFLLLLFISHLNWAQIEVKCLILLNMNVSLLDTNTHTLLKCISSIRMQHKMVRSAAAV